ncbi:MAG: hypothetical protein MUC58_04425 [Rhizobiaceae bacterium]|nr:hypothetical protein [Rhizobiaceae bacterium]
MLDHTQAGTTGSHAADSARGALAIVLALGLVGGAGFAGYALTGGDVLTSLIETTMMWCM